jgi:hypothetical protein
VGRLGLSFSTPKDSYMSETKTKFIIDAEGRFWREDTTIYDIEPGDQLQKAFTSGIVSRIRNVLNLPGHGHCHVVHELDSNTQHWSIPMNTINFKTTFGSLETEKWGKELFPTFKANNDTEHPLIEIEWNKDEAMSKQESQMNIRFVVQIRPYDNEWHAVDHYLYAFDGRNTAWRLPIANLYETAQVCMGDYNSRGATVVKVLEKAIAQLRTASWNSDLFYDTDSVQKFVHFKPLEKGFQTLPIEGAWTKQCQKVVTAYLKFVEI